MSSQIPGQKKHTLFDLLTEVGTILMTIKEKAQTDQSLPKEPLELFTNELLLSKDDKELKANLNRTLSNQKLNVNALVDYVSTLSKVRDQKIPIGAFDDSIISVKKTGEHHD
jgi:seryl-tRNA synthetase